MAIHLVSSIEAREYGAETIRVADLDGDGAPDLLFVQSLYGSRVIQALTAATIRGERLWQIGTPSPDNGRIYSDLPVQVYDWDNDGINEVLFVRQAEYVEPEEFESGGDIIRMRAKRYAGNATMVVLDGRTGREKCSFPIPAPADDSFSFVDLTGRGRREDFLVKDCAWTMWGISRAGETLWRWEGSTGHRPAIGDFDGDGRDEVFTGFALIDHDGTPTFDEDPGYEVEGEDTKVHQDAAYVAQMPDGSWRLLFGNHGLHCLTPDGVEVWNHPLEEAQHVVVGNYRGDSALQVAVIDRGYPRSVEGRPADLYLFDLESGREIWRRRQPPGGWCADCMAIRWTEPEGGKDILVSKRGPGQPVAIYDGDGNVVDEMEVPPWFCRTLDTASLGGQNPGIHYCYRADVCGDSREEVIVAGWRGLRVYANARPLAVPTLYNTTIYHGM